MKLRNTSLAAVAAILSLAPMSGNTQQSSEYGQLKWSGSIYAKFLDGTRRANYSLSSNFDTTPQESGGDQGQGFEVDLKLSSQVSKQVEFYVRVQSRLHRAFWANYAGFAVPGTTDPTPPGQCNEADPRCNQYVKLRGARVILTPGYDWIDSASIGSNDWGMFDPWTQGKSRYIDRDNISGFLFQGSAFEKDLRWDFARVSMPTYQGAGYNTGNLFANDANWVGQLKYSSSPDWNATLIAAYAKDEERDLDDPNQFNGVGVFTRWDNTVLALKGQYSGIDFMDIKAAYYHTDFDLDEDQCDTNLLESCRFTPALKDGANDDAITLNVDFNDLFLDGLSLAVQFFDIGSDYISIAAARREADVLLTEGQEATWQWLRPQYNFATTNFDSAESSKGGVGYGGWNGELQQVVAGGLAENDVTDFDEPVAFDVTGWKGVTLVPKYTLGDWEFSGEYSYIDFNTNWQACNGPVQQATGLRDKDIGCIYPRREGTHSWGLGGDTRSSYAMYQDRQMEIFALKVKYTLDLGKGVDLMARYKYISDEDDRVTNAALLTDAYDGFPLAGDNKNPDWIPNVGLGGCVECDDREADFDTYGLSVGYQLTPDLYAKLIFEHNEVELIDGTIDVAPVGLSFEASNEFGFIEYLTGEHVKDRIGLNFSYFLSGIEFGGTFDYFWGTYDPVFYTDLDGRRVKLAPVGATVVTPLGNIRTDELSLAQYRMKVWMKLNF
jgi:hypothetical protein